MYFAEGVGGGLVEALDRVMHGESRHLVGLRQ